MGKLAFLYPGQGSQKVGMGSDIADQEPELFKRYALAAQRVSGQPISTYCLQGPLEQLSETHIAQPALFTHSLALTEWAQKHGLTPDFVTGHSLGEYTAAVTAGVLSFEEGLYLVCQRGRQMLQRQEQQPGAMCAVIGLPQTVLQDLCTTIANDDIIAIANWNTPTQFIVSGTITGIQKLIQAVKELGKGKTIPLNVKGAFHSPLMQPVQTSLGDIAQWLHWHDGHIPLALNVDGTITTNGPQIQQGLLAQIASPVQWVACIHNLVDAGCDTFLELGSAQVLSRLVRAIAPNVHVATANTLEQVRSFAKTYHKAIHA